MTGFIVVAPPTDIQVGPTTPTYVQPTTPDAFRMSLVGSDGVVWDLNDGPVGLLPGPQGFASPSVTHWWKTSPVVDGSHWDGMKTASKDVQLPIQVTGVDWQDWRANDAAFFRSIHPGAECKLQVTAPDGVTRWLGLRFVAGGELGDIDPLALLASSYVLEFTAPIPFWRGDPVTTTFAQAAPVPFFPGPPFTISPSTLLTTSTVSNPGDEPVWPTYRVEGSAAGWSLGVGDALVSSNAAIPNGGAITVDTDPTRLTVTDASGANLYGSLDQDTFAAIPAAVKVPLSLRLSTPGVNASVSVSFTPLYRRPW